MRSGVQFVLSLALVSRVGFAQESEKPVAPMAPGMKAAMDRLKGEMLRPQPPKKIVFGQSEILRPAPPDMTILGALVPVCSVPLIVVHPPDPEPHGMSVPLPRTYTDNMPALTMPAPPCKDLLSAPPQ